MNNVEVDHHRCDVLVIGGGLAGTWAAIRARDFVDDVIVVEKAKVARSGQSTFAAGVMLAPRHDDDLDAWQREIVESGEYLNDQDWVSAMLHEQPDRIEELAAWGVPFERDADGAITRVVGRGHKTTRLLMFHGPEFMRVMREQALARDVRLVERVQIIDLLTDDGCLPTRGRVCGAIGINTRTGRLQVFQARAVVIATGGVQGKGRFFAGNLTGDGIGMAYRAGAELHGMEFAIAVGGWMFERKYFIQGMNMFQNKGALMINRHGQRYMEKYDPELIERANYQKLVLGISKEGYEGNGPLYMDMTHLQPADWEQFRRVLPQAMRIFDESGVEPWKQKVVFELPSSGFNSLVSGILNNTECETNVPGLFVSGQDGGFLGHGTYSVGGVNLALACVSGRRGGEFSGRYAACLPDAAPDAGQLRDLETNIYAPMKVKDGVAADSIDHRVQDLTHAAPYAHFKDETRIRHVLAGLDEIALSLPNLAAPDAHELVKVHEMRNFLLGCRLVYRAALERRESRGRHVRTDYPYRDDVNWLTRVVLRRDGDAAESEPEVSLRALPIYRWPVRPEPLGRQPSLIPMPQIKDGD
jgi:succinate dehydrogenase / fumarate reductase flavoprotein subunit